MVDETPAKSDVRSIQLEWVYAVTCRALVILRVPVRLHSDNFRKMNAVRFRPPICLCIPQSPVSIAFYEETVLKDISAIQVRIAVPTPVVHTLSLPLSE